MSWITLTIVFVLVFFAAAFALTEWIVRRRRPRSQDDNSATS